MPGDEQESASSSWQPDASFASDSPDSSGRRRKTDMHVMWKDQLEEELIAKNSKRTKSGNLPNLSPFDNRAPPSRPERGRERRKEVTSPAAGTKGKTGKGGTVDLKPSAEREDRLKPETAKVGILVRNTSRESVDSLKPDTTKGGPVEQKPSAERKDMLRPETAKSGTVERKTLEERKDTLKPDTAKGGAVERKTSGVRDDKLKSETAKSETVESKISTEREDRSKAETAKTVTIKRKPSAEQRAETTKSGTTRRNSSPEVMDRTESASKATTEQFASKQNLILSFAGEDVARDVKVLAAKGSFDLDDDDDCDLTAQWPNVRSGSRSSSASPEDSRDESSKALARSGSKPNSLAYEMSTRYRIKSAPQMRSRSCDLQSGAESELPRPGKDTDSSPSVDSDRSWTSRRRRMLRSSSDHNEMSTNVDQEEGSLELSDGSGGSMVDLPRRDRVRKSREWQERAQSTDLDRQERRNKKKAGCRKSESLSYDEDRDPLSPAGSQHRAPTSAQQQRYQFQHERLHWSKRGHKSKEDLESEFSDSSSYCPGGLGVLMPEDSTSGSSPGTSGSGVGGGSNNIKVSKESSKKIAGRSV